MFLGGEVALISTALFCAGKVSYHNMRMSEANKIKTKKFHKQKKDKFKTYTMISVGVASDWYIYNLVDAFTSKKGKIKYDYKKMHLAVVPIVNVTENNYLTAGVSIKF